MKKLLILLSTLIITLIAGCGYPDAGALESGQWIGTIGNPYQGIVSDNFYTWNGTNYVRIPAAGLPGATGATGATGPQGPAGDSGFGQGCEVYSSVNISLTHWVHTALNFNSEYYDNDNIHSTTTNSSRLTCNTSGKYLIIVNIMFTNTPDVKGFMQVQIRLNGDKYLGGSCGQPISTYWIILSASTICDLAVNDYIEAVAYQDTNSSLNILAVAKNSPNIMIQRIGD